MAFTCPRCGTTSHHPMDERHGYCGACHAFTGACAIGACPEPPATVAGNIAVCASHALELGLSRGAGAGMAQLPHLTADEMGVLLHGLARLLPGRWWDRDLATFLPDELERIAGSLATALREGIIAAERTQ
jgi:hypothetical protein